MKLYLVAPVLAANTDETAADARLRECSERIADLILSHVSADPALFGMRQIDESSAPPGKGDISDPDAEMDLRVVELIELAERMGKDWRAALAA